MAVLSQEHDDLLASMHSIKSGKARTNTLLDELYTGEFVTSTLNIAVPPELAGQLGVVSDWPATVVDSYAERMNFAGFRDPSRLGMADAAEASGMSLSVDESVLDSLIFGVGFIAVEPDADGVWSTHTVPPTEGTVLWDVANKRPVAGMRERELFDGSKQTVLYLPNGVAYIGGDNRREVEDFIPHNMGIPTIVRVRNALRSRKWTGRSMITPPVQYYTAAACRTLQGMELNREFYTYPQRWLKNGTMDMFVASDNPTEAEKISAGFKATTGSMLTLPPPAEPGDPEMELHQFASSPPTPFIEQIRAYSQLMASSTGIPAAYLGFSTENPPSAEAIRAWLDRLIVGCRNQQRLIGPDLRRLGWMVMCLNGAGMPWTEFAKRVVERWDDPASPTLASDADAIVKLAGAGVISQTSEWAFDRLRIPEDERRAARQEARIASTRQLLRQPTDVEQAQQMASIRGEQE